MLGFASAIRKEYAWRVKRGESLANLRAVRPADRAPGPGGSSAERRRAAQDLTSREMASAASLTFSWASGPPLSMACGHAVAQVVLQQPDGHRLQRPGGRGDLGQHVHAVGVFLDHALQAAHLALDPAQAPEVSILVLRISAHGQKVPDQADSPTVRDPRRRQRPGHGRNG